MNKYKAVFLIVIAAWAVVLLHVTTIYASGEDRQAEVSSTIIECLPENGGFPESAEIYNIQAQESVTYEDWFRENASVIPDCKITHYCTEKREHICGTGDGITSTGVPVTAGWTCATDPSVIPYGAEVMVDYGGTVEFWKAQDCGGSIKGNHIDLAVDTHENAESLGVKYATVYWLEVDHEFG